MSNHPIKKHDLQQVIEAWDGERLGERDALSSTRAEDDPDDIIFYNEDNEEEWIQINQDACVTDDIARGDMQSDTEDNASSN